MMNYYNVMSLLVINDEICGREWGHKMMDSSENPEEETQCFKGWDWIKLMENGEHLPSHGTCSWSKRGFFKKYFYLNGYNMDGWVYPSYRLAPEDNIRIVTTYTECPVSLEQILKYYDSKKAIQWLKDRGMTTCPLNPQ